MKNLKAAILLSLALLPGLAGCPSDNSESKGPAPLRVAMDPRIGEPFVFQDKEQADKGQPVQDSYKGFEVDISRYVATKLGRPLEIVVVRWPQLAETVRNKKAELAMSAIEKPAKPSEALSHTDRYYTAYQQLAVPKKDKFTYNLSDIKGKKVGVVEGSVAELLLAELNKLKQAKIAVQTFATHQAAFDALASGKLQATLTERAFASWFSWQKKGAIRLTGDPVASEIPYVALIREDNAELKKSVNDILVKARKDPAFKQIFDKWHVAIKR